MLERWECPASEERALNVAREMTLLTQRIIVRTMFGFHDVGEERSERITGAFDTALLGIEARSLMPAWFGRLPLPLTAASGGHMPRWTRRSTASSANGAATSAMGRTTFWAC